MKDVSVTLGKIEERFGEKLDNVNEKLQHLETKKEITSKQIDEAEEEKEVISSLISKSKIDANEKDILNHAIQRKNEEIGYLNNQLQSTQSQLDNILNNSRVIKNSRVPQRYKEIFSTLSISEQGLLLFTDDPEELPGNLLDYAKQLRIIDDKGMFLENRRKLYRELLRNRLANELDE